ncbi:hypothetical protein GLOTRDRAFT_109938 [Gloeophyllum trabeum ATCC 11539]|uniref:Mnn4-regulates the mannosylphosphorylation n=1 Tax=Gloeophyllum trabeum (strain ATCC 11539 / FP-39264 / Madison 617) TaxID=670483 RepID=S7QDJ0_GLOTA|nr:uncharacterized protein GLOTRDRAFT_109938 [Gloeophyllum trabeum ATCC 11539]EPQ57896.1 hypothetical protein GLOTRDRAFT_109938 [Gloeophyllum trabeum ATCC 11539]
MNTLFGSVSRAAAMRRAPLALRRPTSIARPSAHSFIVKSLLPLSSAVHARGVASSVSGRPGSQSVQHAAQNVKEELGNSAADLAKSIAGGNLTVDNVAPTQQTFLGITNAVAHSVPQPYIVFGLLGGVPYIGTAATVVYLARQAGLAAAGVNVGMDPGVASTILDQALNIQVTYGAVMLSFLGALHWGMEFAGYGGSKGYSRLALGAAPVLWAWPTLTLLPTTALIVQWVGFTCLWWADLRATTAGWAPKWYSQYRFYLSILVGTCIIGTLAGTSYWGPVAGHGLLSHDLNMVRAERKRAQPERTGTVAGDVEAVAAPEDADVYVIVRKKKNGNDNAESEGEASGSEAEQ